MRTLIVLLAFLPLASFGWGNGQSGNASTNLPEECISPPYSTHDWIADNALELLPASEKAWLSPHKTMYLLGTEAPDNRHIPIECNTPHSGYDDRGKGHSVEWSADWTMINDRPAVRAEEEYQKAVAAYRNNNFSAAAFYLGAMAHYIGDVTQYGHSVPFENNHSNYESWVGRRTKNFTSDVFSQYIVADNLIRRTPYTAVKRISKVTAGGNSRILWASRMDELYVEKKDNQAYLDSIGHSLNFGVNELADVLHRFYLNEVE